jgi:anti-sigma regulatory factor (Ser/Thr protein kinase)
VVLGETTLPRDAVAASVARRWLERELPAEASEDAAGTIKLLTTELVNNAYQHGRGAIRLVLGRHGERVRVEVIDEGQDAALRVKPAAPGQGGHGLRIVDQLASAWGAFEGTTHVWAEIPFR